MTTLNRSLILACGLLGLTACQPPVVEAHLEPRPPACDDPAIQPTPGSLSVTGTATLDVAPDAADVKLDLTSRAASPRAAVKKLRSQEEAMRTLLDEEGIEAETIAVSTITLHPTHRWDANRERQVLTGYEAKLCVTVETGDFALIPGIVEAGAKAGVTTSSTAFRNTKMSELKSQVREMALEAAKSKAGQFRDALGLELTRVVSVGETQSGQAWSRYTLGLDNAVANVAGFAGTTRSSLQAETLPLTLTVTVAYEIA